MNKMENENKENENKDNEKYNDEYREAKRSWAILKWELGIDELGE